MQQRECQRTLLASAVRSNCQSVDGNMPSSNRDKCTMKRTYAGISDMYIDRELCVCASMDHSVWVGFQKKPLWIVAVIGSAAASRLRAA